MIKSSYLNLPSHFYDLSKPTEFSNPQLIIFNEELAKDLGLKVNPEDKEELARLFSGQKIFPNTEPMAMAYAGHQFGHFVPQLGDGRAHIIGEGHINGKTYDIQLKGSGRTAFSRGGDGLSWIGPVLREYIVSEAMHVLGVPTTRALAAVSTGDDVRRETKLPGGVFTRVASSHLRVGTFQYFAARSDVDSLAKLLNFAVNRHYPHLENNEDLALHFLKAVGHAQAELIAKWLGLGFIHGVMNTDNCAISGETIDYGPCAFMDKFSYQKVFSSIDRYGRYAYGNQQKILLWNLTRLAECLLPLLKYPEDIAVKKLEDTLGEIGDYCKTVISAAYLKKLGLPENANFEVVVKWLEKMEAEKLDFTLAYRSLPERLTDGECDFDKMWKDELHAHDVDTQKLPELLNQMNPLYIPRNHLIEAAIQDAVQGDYSKFHKLHQVLKNPYKEQEGCENYALSPNPEEEVEATFCGT